MIFFLNNYHYMLTFKKTKFLYDIITLELMAVYQVKFGKFISILRKEQNLTQDELAEKLNISSGKTISKWENGNAIPDFETIIELSKIFNVSLYELSICERIKKKSIKKEEILKIVNPNQIRKISIKRKIKWIFITLLSIISIISILYTFTNFDTTQVYTLESMNKEYKINGTYTKTKEYSVLAITDIGYVGNNRQLSDSYISNYNYELYSNQRMIYNHEFVKNIINKSEIIFHELLSKISIYVDSNSDRMHEQDNLDDLNLIITYLDKNEREYNIEIPIKLIKQYSDDKIA